MDKLIEPIVSVLEMLVLGAITIIFAIYAVVFFHPCKRVLGEYIQGISKYFFATLGAEEQRWLKIGVLLGVAYYTGVLVNAAAYRFLQRAHLDIIASVQVDPAKRQQSGGPEHHVPTMKGWDSTSPWLLVPFRWNSASDETELRHGDSMYAEAEWRNANGEVASHGLDRLVKHIQLLRGTVLIAACFAVLALFKVSVALWTMLRLGWATRVDSSPTRTPSKGWPDEQTCERQRQRHAAKWWYRNFVDEHNHRLAGKGIKEIQAANASIHSGKPEVDDRFDSAQDFERRRTITRRAVLAPNAVIFIIAAIVYVVAMYSWRLSEFEYHAIVLAGQSTEKKADEGPPKTAPAGPRKVAR
jgi:hypothetical protein